MTEKQGDSSPVSAGQHEERPAPRTGHPRIADSAGTGCLSIRTPGVEHPEAEAYWAFYGRPNTDGQLY